MQTFDTFYLIEVEQAPADTDQSTSLLGSSYLLWIIIACVAFVAVVVIAAIVIVVCRKKNKQKDRDAANNQPNSPKPQPPDLWIDHEQVSYRNPNIAIHG